MKNVQLKKYLNFIEQQFLMHQVAWPQAKHWKYVIENTMWLHNMHNTSFCLCHSAFSSKQNANKTVPLSRILSEKHWDSIYLSIIWEQYYECKKSKNLHFCKNTLCCVLYLKIACQQRTNNRFFITKQVSIWLWLLSIHASTSNF